MAQDGLLEVVLISFCIEECQPLLPIKEGLVNRLRLELPVLELGELEARKPRVVHYLKGALITTSNSLFSILIEKLCDEISEFFRVRRPSLVGDLELASDDSICDQPPVSIVERRESKKHLVHNDAN